MGYGLTSNVIRLLLQPGKRQTIATTMNIGRNPPDSRFLLIILAGLIAATLVCDGMAGSLALSERAQLVASTQ